MISKSNLIFTNRIIEDKAYMLLDRVIGPNEEGEPYIDGSQFADEMYMLKANNYHVTVKINSPGGRVDHGFSIIDAIQTTGADTHLIGLGASMAGMVFLFGKKKIAEQWSTLMFHASKGGNKTYTGILNGQFSSMLASFSRMPKEIATGLMDGKDYFFDISKIEEYGLADVIKSSAKAFDKPKNATPMELYLAYNSILTDEQKPKNEMSFFKTIFGKDSDQENAMAAMNMKVENEQLRLSEAALKAKLNDTSTALALLKSESDKAKATADAESLIASAEKAGKFAGIKSEDRAKLVDNASENFDTIKLIIDSMPSGKTEAVASVANTDKKATLTYAHLAEKEPAKLAEIATNDPELFERLSKEYNESKNNKN